MKNYTKQITAFAVLSLFAYSANAQTAILVNTTTPITGPTAGLTITPAADDAAGNLEIDTDGELVGTPTLVVNPDGSATITTVTKLGEAKEEYSVGTVVGGGDSVEITNTGINLNQTSTVTTKVKVDRRLTTTVEIDAGGNTVTTWLAEAIAADGTTVISYTSASDVPTGPGTFESAADAETSLNEWLDGTDIASLTINDPIFQGDEGDPVLSGGDLTVGGNLAVGAIGDVEQAVTVNADDITTLNGDVNLAGSVANSIAGALDDTGVSDNGIVGVIEKRADGTVKLGENSFIFDDTTASHVLTADGAATEIVLGGDILSTAGVESVNIRVANNLDVDGAANVDGVLSLGDSGNGAVADVASAINANTAANLFTQADVNQNEFDSDAADFALGSRIDNNASAIANNSSRIASNKEDIEQNTRGIAMVAALQHTTVLPGMNNAFDLSAAHFEGETGLALNYARRINENVQINFGAASTTDFDESVIKAGIGVQW